MAGNNLITLTSDFGSSEHYVGAMKGVIYNINPTAHVVDLCNSVNSYDLLDAALTISQAYHYYPAGTVHVVVVDPGVGSARRPILVATGKHLFVAPDNGVLSLVFGREERVSVRHITSEHYFLQPVSNTFHGRDIFAACAGFLSKGVDPGKFGDEISDFVRFSAPKPKPAGPNLIKGVVIKVDKFGNLITNITPQDAAPLFAEQPPAFKIVVGKAEVRKLHSAYAEGAPGEVFGILGSMGFLEVATNRGSAQHSVSAEKGSEVALAFGEAAG